PGETEEEFMETYRFIAEIEFSELHVFPYSKRTGTPAARMENQVPDDVKNERVHRLIALSDQLAKQYASKFEREILEVIPEERDDSGFYTGYSDNYLKIRFPAEAKNLIGEIVRVKITKAGYPINEGELVSVLTEVAASKAH